MHASFDLFGDGKSVLKGGFGRFANLREVNPEVTASNRNNRTTTTWVWHDNNNNRNYDPGEVNFDPNGNDFRSITGVTDQVPNPDESQPFSDEWSVTFEREIIRRLGLQDHRDLREEFQPAADRGNLPAVFRLQHSHHEPRSRQ